MNKISTHLGFISLSTVVFTIVLLVPIVVFSQDRPKQVYALIVANNNSLNPELSPLRYADNDAAKYYQIFTASGAQTSLLTVLDPISQKTFPNASKSSSAPNYQNLSMRVFEIFEKIAKENTNDVDTHFVFVYSGHGGIGPNQEGFITLLDRKFTRSQLYKEIIAKSPATYNHIILDACESYYFVNKRGENAQKDGHFGQIVNEFLRNEELLAYPNTGVILASSSESETHEWNRWEAGIFSHELRSAFLGAGDVNQDGSISYAEAAAFVNAANAAVDLPRAKLQVYYKPPAQDEDAPIFLTSRIKAPIILQMAPNAAGKYYVEDASGVRVADLHYSEEQSVHINILGAAPFFVRIGDKEAIVNGDSPVVPSDSLTFLPLAASSKGTIEMSFRKNLFKIPFGRGFYNGAVTTKAGLLVSHEVYPKNNPPTKLTVSPEIEQEAITITPMRDDNSRRTKILGWSAIAVGGGLLLGGGLTYYAASQNYERWKNTDDETSMADYKESSDNQVITSRVLLISGSGLLATGSIMLMVAAIQKRRNLPKASTLQFSVSDTAMGFSLLRTF